MIFILLFGANFFWLARVENDYWSFLECVYYGIITLTTVGLGDFSLRWFGSVGAFEVTMLILFSIVGLAVFQELIQACITAAVEVLAALYPELYPDEHHEDISHCDVSPGYANTLSASSSKQEDGPEPRSADATVARAMPEAGSPMTPARPSSAPPLEHALTFTAGTRPSAFTSRESQLSQLSQDLGSPRQRTPGSARPNVQLGAMSFSTSRADHNRPQFRTTCRSTARSTEYRTTERCTCRATERTESERSISNRSGGGSWAETEGSISNRASVPTSPHGEPAHGTTTKATTSLRPSSGGDSGSPTTNLSPPSPPCSSCAVDTASPASTLHT